MTTCFVSRKHAVIVADTRMVDGDSGCTNTDKIEPILRGKYKGWYFVWSGSLRSCKDARRWIINGLTEASKPEFEYKVEDEDNEYSFSILLVSPDGTVVLSLADDLEPVPLNDTFIGIGTGAAYALGALEAGAAPNKAMRIAIARDPNTGGHIKTVRLDKR